MGAREDWERYCEDEDWYLSHMRGGQLHHHQLALAAIAEQAAEIERLRAAARPAVPGDPARLDIYPEGWVSDLAVNARLASGFIDAAEAAKLSGQVTILADKTAGREIAAIVSLPWLGRDAALPAIPEEELRVELHRTGSSKGAMDLGAEQAVRITHIPTGLQAISSGERSQLQNKAVALTRLQEKLAGRARREGMTS